MMFVFFFHPKVSTSYCGNFTGLSLYRLRGHVVRADTDLERYICHEIKHCFFKRLCNVEKIRDHVALVLSFSLTHKIEVKSHKFMAEQCKVWALKPTF